MAPALLRQTQARLWGRGEEVARAGWKEGAAPWEERPE